MGSGYLIGPVVQALRSFMDFFLGCFLAALTGSTTRSHRPRSDDAGRQGSGQAVASSAAGMLRRPEATECRLATASK